MSALFGNIVLFSLPLLFLSPSSTPHSSFCVVFLYVSMHAHACPLLFSPFNWICGCIIAQSIIRKHKQLCFYFHFLRFPLFPPYPL
ncbi:MAG: hypothetical protein J3R72DRAFT_460786 [Linnemannia gamsii]|nr:MAG: hypothetical protein J3R72DRAFT_460786 [Linnemannia gamsii]